MSLRLVASSTLWQLTSQVTMAALSILTVKFVAIGLTRELAGNYNSAYGYLQLFGILADCGLYAVAVHEVSKAKDKEKVLGALITLRIIALTLSLGLALLIALNMPMWKNTPLPLGIAIAATVPLFTLLAGMTRVVFQVKYKMHWVFVAEVTQRIITVALIGAFIVAGVRNTTDLSVYYAFLAIGGLGALVLFVISLIAGNMFITTKPIWDGELLLRLFKRAAPYALAYLAMALYRQLDVTLIALLRHDYELQNASYGFVIRMTDMGFLIPTFLLNSVLPLLTDDKKQRSRVLGATLSAILVLGVTAMLFAFLWARPITQLLTTDAYLSTPTQPGADTALYLLSVPLLLNGIVLYGFYVLLFAHAWKRLVITMMGAAVLSIGLNLILIPPLGFVGAAVTSSAVHLLLALVLWEQSKTVVTVTIERGVPRRILLFAVFLALVLAILRPALTSALLTCGGLAIMGPILLGLLWTTNLIPMRRR